ncbi:trypsin-like peptidase domain-containing protein, partial [candidate division KSB1 bacterium]|nr:trypsin-like peptidase domain-containing protein [candidate division KSB1 bacterium]
MNYSHRILKKTYLIIFGFILAYFFLMVCSGKENDAGPKALSDAVYSEQRGSDAGADNQIAAIQDAISNSRHNAITRAVARVSPAVVGINVIQVQRYVHRNPFADDPFFRNFFQDIPYERRVKSLGSGFIISKEGYILTNQHVIDQATEIIVTRAGGKQYVAREIGQDYTTDLAILKIEGD